MVNKCEDLYSKIPNRLFYSVVEGEDSILKYTKFKDKTLLILDYLYMQINRRKIIKFTLENMIVECGFVCSTKKGETNYQFKEILSILHEIGVIEFNGDFTKISPKELVICSLTINLDNQYIELYDSEKEKIHNQTIDRVDNLKLLVYYCYLKCRMYRRPKDDKIEVSGGKAEVAYPAFKQITEDLGITDDTIDKYNQVLVALDLIRYKSAGTWYYIDDPNKIVRESVNFYTLFTDEETADHNLNEGIKFYKKMDRNSNKIFTGSKEYKNNNKKLNGELGSIIKKEKHGVATEKDIARKNEILNSINVNDEQYGIQALLEANPNELLSSIYSGFNSDKKAEKYYELEESLGLINDSGDLLIDYDYYKWIMINYNKDEHIYYKNCIDKHKRGIDKPKGLQNKKRKEVDDSEFIKEMGWGESIVWNEDDELFS